MGVLDCENFRLSAGWTQNAIGGYIQYKAQEELARFAGRMGLNLKEFNTLLAINSKIGIAVAGTTYSKEDATIEGFFSRDKGEVLRGTVTELKLA